MAGERTPDRVNLDYSISLIKPLSTPHVPLHLETLGSTHYSLRLRKPRTKPDRLYLADFEEYPEPFHHLGVGTNFNIALFHELANLVDAIKQAVATSEPTAA